MRKSRVLALVIASVVSTASFAGAQAPAAAPQAGRRAMGHGMEGRRGERGALRGIKLSDAEKAKVKDVHAKYAAEGKRLRESMKPIMQEERALRQKGDTAGLRALRERNKGNREQMQAFRAREQADIRAVLTPENQKLFDANVEKQAEWAKNGKGGMHRGPRAGTAG